MSHPMSGVPASLRTPYVIDRAGSAVLVATRSSVGPIEFATTDLTGTAEVGLAAGALEQVPPPAARLELAVDSLTSGNSLYDAQVRERLESRLFPTIVVTLRGARAIDETRWSLSGDLTIHGTTRALSGSAEVSLLQGERIRVQGEQVIDIRDFDIELPSVLMLRIFPDVTVRFHVEAVPLD